MERTQKVTLCKLRKKKNEKQPITMITAYDYPSALMVDEAGVDIILVGDTLAMTVLGHQSTVPVTMDEMIHHCKAVFRGTKNAFLIGDMPFLSYQVSTAEAVRNAGRFLKEANMDAVKLEGGEDVIDAIQAIVKAGIPIMGHLGLTPQTATKLGGYKVQGKKARSAKKILNNAYELEKAGCFAIVLEAVPAPVAKVISEKLKIPVIGIGAGMHCDGQVLVYHDLLGIYEQFVPKFVKQYANLRQTITKAVQNYCHDIQERNFPSEEHCYTIDEDELKQFLNEIDN